MKMSVIIFCPPSQHIHTEKNNNAHTIVVVRPSFNNKNNSIQLRKKI